MLIIIGGTTILQKTNALPEPVTDVRTGSIFTGMRADHGLGVVEDGSDAIYGHRRRMGAMSIYNGSRQQGHRVVDVVT